MIGKVRREAFAAASQAYAAATEGRVLIADLADGWGMTAKPRKGFAAWAQKAIAAIAEYAVALMVAKLKTYIPMLSPPKEPPKLDLAWLEDKEFPIDLIVNPKIDA